MTESLSLPVALDEIARAANLESPFFEAYYLDEAIPDYGYDQPYQEWDSILAEHTKVCIEGPFGCGKSTKLTVIETIKLIIRNRDIRILIISNSFTLAKDYLERIKAILSLPKVEAHFGRFRSELDWSKTQITVLGRTIAHKEPTVRVSSLHANWEGWRGEVIVCDDPIDIKSLESKVERAKVRDRFEALRGRLEDGGFHRMLIVGNPWHNQDLYVHISGIPEFHYRQYPAEVNGEPIFPSRLSTAKVDQERKNRHPTFFKLHYMLERGALEGKILKAEWLQHVPSREIPKGLDIMMAVDPAISDSPTADFSAIVVVGRDKVSGKIYVLWVWRDRVSAPELIEAIKTIYKQFKPRKIRIESQAFQLAIGQILRTHGPYPFEEVTSNRSKHYRFMAITGIGPLFQNGTILLPDQAVWLNLFVEEYLDFDESATHDDQLDALQYAVDGYEREIVEVFDW